MAAKVLNTPDGTFILDEKDEENIDFSSIAPLPDKKADNTENNQAAEDIVSVNGKEYKGNIKIFSILENVKTGKKKIKIVLES